MTDDKDRDDKNNRVSPLQEDKEFWLGIWEECGKPESGIVAMIVKNLNGKLLQMGESKLSPLNNQHRTKKDQFRILYGTKLSGLHIQLSVAEKLNINPEEPAMETGAPEDINGYQPMPYPEERPYSQFKKNGFVTANKAGVPVYYYDYM